MKSSSVVAKGQGRSGDWLQRGAKEFWGEREIFYDCGGSYTTIHTCQNSSICTVKINEFYSK